MHVDYPHRISDRAGVWTLEAIGAVLAAMGALIIVVSPDPEETALLLAETVVAVGFPAILVYAGYWIGNRELSPPEQWAITGWTAGGIVVAVLFGQWILFRQGAIGGIIVEPAFFLLSCAAIGSLTGLGAGMVVRSLHAPAPAPPRDAASAEARDSTDRTDETPEHSSGRTNDAPERTTDRPETRIPDSTIADLAALLTDPRRLRIVTFLRDREEDTVDFETVVDHLAETEDESARQRREIAISLHHRHLPMLEEANVISYQHDSKRIRYTPSRYSNGSAAENSPRGGE